MRYANHPARGSGLLELLPAGAALDAARSAFGKLSQVEQDTLRTCSMELAESCRMRAPLHAYTLGENGALELLASLGRFMVSNGKAQHKPLDTRRA